MSLSELTTPGAVLAAVNEFDKLGREQFLRKYGFGPSRIYFLEHNGKLYDSKAVVGAALAFQFPQRGPLSPNQFSGGDATVRRKLEELGFHVHIEELSPDIKFSEILGQVLDLQESWTRDNTPEMKLRGRLIRDAGPNALKALLPLPSTLSFRPSVQGRDGTGGKTRVPFIRIYDETRSPSATMGWYVVFLFSADGHAAFLSLNQGATTVSHGSFKNRPSSFITEQVAKARSIIAPIQNDRLLTSIELHDSGGKGELYEKGNIVAIQYSRNELPDELLLKADIELMLRMLNKIYVAESGEMVDNQAKEILLPTHPDISSEIVQSENKFASTAIAIRCLVDDFDKLLEMFLDFTRVSQFDIDLTTSVDVLAAVLSSQFLLFAGPSGTGKSSLARVLARFFTTDDAWRVLEAHRQWIGPEDAFGYYSPLTGHYALTSSSIDLIELHQIAPRWLSPKANNDSTNLVVPILIIEEANLSPIEGYLAPIIHGISSPSTAYVKVPLHAKLLGATDPEGSFIIPCNVLLGPFPRFFGTINVDPTSQAPAHKVSARASVILLEPDEHFDPAAAAVFLGTVGTASTEGEDLPSSGQGRQWIGDPSAARAACTEVELREFTDAIAVLLKRIVSDDYEELIHVSRRDLERCVNYMAYFLRLGEAASDSTLNRSTLLALAAENAVLHVILPNLSAYNFRASIQALLKDDILRTPSRIPDRIGGLLLPRLRHLQASTTGVVFAEALDFWACLS